MTLGDLVPWGRRERTPALQRGSSWASSGSLTPVLRLHHEMNQLFDDVFQGFSAPGPIAGGQWPSLEVQETDEGYRVTAELPGMDQNDIEISVEDGVLSIRGEKRSETENRDRTVSERYYGRFERRLSVGDVDDTQATAKFDKGVLSIELPRSPQARDRVRRIPINDADTRH